jgi:hypothetical protein
VQVQRRGAQQGVGQQAVLAEHLNHNVLHVDAVSKVGGILKVLLKIRPGERLVRILWLGPELLVVVRKVDNQVWTEACALQRWNNSKQKTLRERTFKFSIFVKVRGREVRDEK